MSLGAEDIRMTLYDIISMRQKNEKCTLYWNRLMSPPQPSGECAPARPISLQTKLAYSSGNLGKSFLWNAFESVLLYFLVFQAGLSAGYAGALLASLMVWDGLADLAISYQTDRTGRRDAQARLIRVAAPLAGAGFALIFAAPGLARTALTVAAVVASRIGYTLGDVGHNTLLLRVVRTERDSADVSALRLIFSALGGGGVGLALAKVLAIGDRAEQHHAFVIFGMVGGALYAVTLIFAQIATASLGTCERKPLNIPAVQMLRHLLANRSYRFALCVVAIQSMLIPFFMRALPFFGQVVMRDAAWAGLGLMIITLGQSISLPLWMGAARHISTRTILAASHVGLILSIGCFALSLKWAGDMLFLALIGGCQAGMNTAIWARLAMSVKSEGDNERVGEAFPVGLFVATLKAASGLGTGLLTILVARVVPICPSCAPAAPSIVVIGALGIPVLGAVGVLSLQFMSPNRA